jgi:predicted DNA binding CopG/RHH family protein
MKKEYDFTVARPNPYAKKLKQAITIRVDPEVIQYFKDTANAVNVPYQTLINSYLKDCADNHKKPVFSWK